MPGVPNRWSETFRRFKEDFNHKKAQYECAVLTAALIRPRTSWDVFRGDLAFTRADVPGAQPIEPQDFDCGAIRLVKRVLRVDDAYHLVERCRTRVATLGPEEFRMGPFCEDTISSYALARMNLPFEVRADFEWPYLEFHFQPNHRKDPPLPEEPLMGPFGYKGLTADQVVDGWTGLREIQLVGGGKSFLRVVLPDLRARLERVEYSDGEVFVSAEHFLLPRERTRIHSGFGPLHVMSPAVPIKGRGDAETAVTYEPPALHVALVEVATNEIVDWARLSPRIAARDPRVRFLTPQERMMRLLRGGDNDHVEFKRELGNGHTIVVTVCAFANTHGGTAIVGADDNGAPVGVDSKREQTRLRDMIHSNSEPPIRTRFSVQQIDGRELLLVEVPAGLGLPYLYKPTGTVYVRHGSSNQPATPSEMNAMYRGRSTSHSWRVS